MGFTPSQQINYIETRSGEYNAQEQQILNDPWVFGYDAGTRGDTLADALEPIRSSCKRTIVCKAQMMALCEKGWHESKS